MTTVTSSTDAANVYSQLNTGSSTANTSQSASDRFLKLLVTQMQNQDPLNPMDNAQVTSQMAQINTVTGIQQLNDTITNMLGQFQQLQSLQGASLVGRGVLVQGNSLDVANGTASAGFSLVGPADSVKVDVLAPSGQVIDTIDLGAQSAGKHGFQWTAPAGVSDGSGLTFRVTAKSGAATVSSTPLVGDQVAAVSMSGGTLTLELVRGGSVPYSQVQAFD